MVLKEKYFHNYVKIIKKNLIFLGVREKPGGGSESYGHVRNFLDVLIREAEKKTIFLVAGPFRGGRGI